MEKTSSSSLTRRASNFKSHKTQKVVNSDCSRPFSLLIFARSLRSHLQPRKEPSVVQQAPHKFPLLYPVPLPSLFPSLSFSALPVLNRSILIEQQIGARLLQIQGLQFVYWTCPVFDAVAEFLIAVPRRTKHRVTEPVFRPQTPS